MSIKAVAARGSLYRRVLLAVCAATLLAWTMAAGWLVYAAREDTDRTLDAALMETGQLVLALAARDLGTSAIEAPRARDNVASRSEVAPPAQVEPQVDAGGRSRHRQRERERHGASDKVARSTDRRAIDEAYEHNKGDDGKDAEEIEEVEDVKDIDDDYRSNKLRADRDQDRTRQSARLNATDTATGTATGTPNGAGIVTEKGADTSTTATPGPGRSSNAASGFPRLERLFYQVRRADGTLALRSPGAPRVAMTDAGERGLADRIVEGVPWRIHTVADRASGLVVHIGEPGERRARFARDAALRLLAPGTALLLLLAAATAWAIHLALQPLREITTRVDALQPGAAQSGFTGLNAPREIGPLLDAIDRLQRRISEALVRERTLTADIAHELRTPLAALRAQAQWAARASVAADREQALAGVMQSADRCARLAEAVLTLARLDGASFNVAAQDSIDLAQVAALVLKDVAHAAATRAAGPVAMTLTAGRHGEQAPRCRADPDALTIALRNLLDNAVRHARSEVAVTLDWADAEVVITVQDDGEGVAPEDRSRLFDRFWRGSDLDASDGGSGLGLALVQRVAQLHGATLSVHDGLHGRGLGIGMRLSI